MQNFSQLLHLRPAASTCLKTFIIGSHLLAVVALYLTAIPGLLKGGLLLLIGFSSVQAWRRFVSCSAKDAVCHAVWMADDSWQVTNGRGLTRQVNDFSILLCRPALTVLEFTFDDKRRAVLLLCTDNINPELSRQLRVRLHLYH